MRPIKRGRAPKRAYAKYQDALGDLEEALGRYCSYCERHFPAGLAVEHVVPKSRAPKLRTVWKNFLIACSNCNSVKKAKPTNLRDFLWPDLDNTFRAFTYDNGLANVAVGLRPKAHGKADNLFKLVGLHRHPGQTKRADKPAKRDDRWQQRESIWKLALLERQKLARNDNDDFRDTIVVAAKGYGFFSVWMAVFANDQKMRCRLISAFKGTACFNAIGQPVARGRL